MTEIRSKVMVKKNEAIQDFNKRNDHQMIAASEFKSDLANQVYLRSVFQTHFEDEEVTAVDNHKEEYNQNLMLIKFKEYEIAVQQLLEDIDQREECIVQLDDYVGEQVKQIEDYNEKITALEEELGQLDE